MTAVDTNLVVRLLTRDDEKQYKKASRLFENAEIYISKTVLLECEWVLRYAYSFSAHKICRAFRMLLGMVNVHTSDPVVIHQALEWHEHGMDFADALHLSDSQHCDKMKTFDKKFVKKTPTLSACQVTQL